MRSGHAAHGSPLISGSGISATAVATMTRLRTVAGSEEAFQARLLAELRDLADDVRLN